MKYDAQITIKEVTIIIPAKKVAMLQMAANDMSRKEIANETGISVRTVEAAFDSVRKALAKKTFPATLVELVRKNIIK